VENIHATFAQHFRQKNAEQTTRRMRARVMNGYWPFQAPVGYEYHSVKDRGRMLRRKEPEASVVREALEGFADGRFDTQADVMRFLQDHPLFPKDRSGIVRNQRVSILLRNPVYAGYIEVPKWNIALREGQHEGLISFQAFRRIQDKLEGKTTAPRRRNINEDFPLRGYVLCADCGTPLTACWSKGRISRHPYYLCPKRGCDSYGKSIRRERIESEFATLLQSAQPSEKLFTVAERMLRKWWDGLLANGEDQKRALAAQLGKIERDVEKLLERILDVSEPRVLAAFEDRVRRLEDEKIVLRERMAKGSRPASNYDQTLRTALAFLANPWNLWRSGCFEERRTVLKLMFAERLRYARNEGFRTANLTLPFKVLGALKPGENKMARPKGFEPLTPRFVVWCSIQLSYGRAPGRSMPAQTRRQRGRLASTVVTYPLAVRIASDYCRRMRSDFSERLPGLPRVNVFVGKDLRRSRASEA
jgi:site-specific DNA recombinase